MGRPRRAGAQVSRRGSDAPPRRLTELNGRRPITRLSFREFIRPLRWLDGRPLADTIEPYRWRIFEQMFDGVDEDGQPRRNLALVGRSKKNFKTTDLDLAALYCLLANDSPGGNQCYIIAN